MHGNYRLWLVVLAVLLLLPAELVPQGAVAPEKQADLLFKALGYDRNLKNRPRGYPHRGGAPGCGGGAAADRGGF